MPENIDEEVITTRGSPKPTPQAPAVSDYDHSFLVVIACDTYERTDELTTLKYAESDGRRVIDALTKAPHNFKLLLHLTGCCCTHCPFTLFITL